MTLLPPSASARKHTATSDSTTTAETSESEADAALSKQTDKRRNHLTRIFTRWTRTEDDSASTKTSAAVRKAHTPSAVNQSAREVTTGWSDSSRKRRTPQLPAPTIPEKPSRPAQVVNDSSNRPLIILRIGIQC